MRLDRYTGQPAKFQVFRRVDGGDLASSDQGELATDEILVEGVRYKRVPPFDYFVLALKDKFVPPALEAYGTAARDAGDVELAVDIDSLEDEALTARGRKNPD